MHVASIDVVGWTDTKLGEGFLNLRGEGQLRIDSGAVQLTSSKRILRHDGERCRHPPAAAVEGADGVLALDTLRELDDRGALIRRFREDLNRAPASKPAEPLACSRRDEAGDARQPLRAAKRLQVFVENLLGGRL